MTEGVKHDLKAVLFDADGTILDTRELIYESYRTILTAHGYEMPTREDLARFGGRPAEETYGHFAKHHDASELYEKHRMFQMEHLDLFKAYEGFDELVGGLKAAGLKVGICTNRATNVLDLLEHVGIKHHFDKIMHADLMDQVKPHPEGIIKVCAELGVDPSAAVMVGDNEADIGAGKAAGCALTIGITHGTRDGEYLKQVGADYIVDHFRDIVPLVT